MAMMVLWTLVLLVVPLLAYSDYSGSRLVNVRLNFRDEAKVLDSIGNAYLVDFLNIPMANRTCNIVVHQQFVSGFLDELTGKRFVYTVDEKDVKELIEEGTTKQSPNDGFRSFRPFNDLSNIFGKFPRYIEIMRWLKQVVHDYPQLAAIENIGQTYDGKPMTILKISNGDFGEKKIIWIDGAIHGREWISATTVLYLIHQVLTGYSSGRTHLLDAYDWVFLPVANPDGYEFSHSSDRLWRKNRRPIVMNCYGVDLNRNFGIHWGVTKGSVSSQGCSNEYGGSAPFSEPETVNIRRYLAKLGDRLEIFLSFHSYSQLWLVPWGYTASKPDDYDHMSCVANEAVKAAREVHGLDYRVGTLSDVLYAAAGGSFDWAKANGATYAYTVELRPSADQVGLVFDRGFLATVHEILPAGQEMWAAIVKMIETINKGVCL